MRLYVVCLAALVFACSSSSADEPDCSDISGNWSGTSTRNGGDCDPGQFNGGEGTFTLAKEADGRWLITSPSFQGGCHGQLNQSTCKFTASCSLFSDTGATLATETYDFTFAGKSYSGNTIAAAFPPVVASRCTANSSDSGQKL